MELYQLRYVLMLARERSFSKAAAKLFITQPTLSQQIKKFETELGFSLFRRNTKSVALTAYGEQFVERAKSVVSGFDAFEQWTVQTRGLRKSALTFGASALSMPHVSACIPDFLALFPEVRFSYTEDWDPALLDMVRSGALDMVLVSLAEDEGTRAGLTVFPLREEYVCVVTSDTHPLHDRESVTLSDLAGEKIVSTSNQSGLLKLMKNEFALQGLEPNFTMNLMSIEARLSMVMKGAVTFVMNEQFKIYNQECLSVIPLEPKIYKTLALVTAADKTASVLEETLQQIIRDSLSTRLESD